MKPMFRRARIMLRFTGFVIALIALILLGFHFWFINHSEKAIEDLITWASNGKLKSNIHKFRIDYLNNTIEIKNFSIVNTDSSAQSTSYLFSTKDFHLRIRSRWDLVFNRQLLIDSVVFNSPDIIVTRRGVKQNDTSNKKLLLAEELGNIYKAISQSLTVLNLQRFEISEGKVLISDADKSFKAPFRLSHIFLSVDKLNIDSASSKDSSRFIFSDRIFLRIGKQHILLPDNKSNVSFDELQIDSKEKRIHVANPVVNILPMQGQKNSISISARLLNITGLDFNALYQRQLIKADSVFIESPDGKLEIYADKKSNASVPKKKTPLDSALLHLPVAVNISHIVIQHADGLMHLHQGEKTTAFQTKNDNVSIVGVRINDSLGNMPDIDGFNYTARNYIGYTPDSIYRFRFDSLQFVDNKVVLYHFNAVTENKQKANLIRDYSIPRFEITGMDWFSFIFNNHFKARDAVLYNPVLNIEKNNAFAGNNDAESKKSIYQTLSVMDSLIDLDKLQIVQGNFSLKQGNNLNLQLQHLDLNIDADALTKAKSVNQIVNSVKQLSFDTATVTNPSATLSITKSNFNSKVKSLLLNNVFLNSGSGNIMADLNGVALNDFSFSNNELEVNGVQWKDGIIHIDRQNGNSEKSSPQIKTPVFFLNNISATNTAVFFKNKNISAGVFFSKLTADNLTKRTDQPFELENLIVTGNNAKLSLPHAMMQCNEFMILDRQKSELREISFEQKTDKDTILINMPSFTFIPFLKETIETNAVTADSLRFYHPEIFLSLVSSTKKKMTGEKPSHFPKMDIKRFTIEDASVQVNTNNKKTKTVTNIKNISFSLKNVVTQKDNNISANAVLLDFNNALFKKDDSITVNAHGNIIASLNTFSFDPSNQGWRAQLDKLSLGSVQYAKSTKSNKNSMMLMNGFSAENAIVNSADLKQPLEWLVNHSGVNIVLDQWHWQNEGTELQLTGFRFNQQNRKVVINSFSVDPGKNKDDFIKSLVYRKDYIEANTGNIAINGVEMNDGTMRIPEMEVDHAVLNVYSNKLKKPGPETIQPLPVTAIKKIPLALRIDRVQLNEMKVGYTELNEETRQTGNVYFHHINGDILNVFSKPDIGSDSLRIMVSSRFLDTMQLHLIINESYIGPTHGLHLQLQLGSGDTRLFNSFLMPLTSIQVKSGFIDTMSMNAWGNEYTSHGSMRLFYHDLKAEKLDSGNTQHRRMGTKLMSFFASALAVKSNNSKRQADFKFVRIRQKSSISYLLTMIVQGAAGNVVPLTKVIYRKEFKKEMKKPAEKKEE